MLYDSDFAPTHERADYCDGEDELSTPTPLSEAEKLAMEAEILAWEANPSF